jgi:hypothetical protein
MKGCAIVEMILITGLLRNATSAKVTLTCVAETDHLLTVEALSRRVDQSWEEE